MKCFALTAAVFFTAAALTPAYAAPCELPAGVTWKNQLGSAALIKVDAAGNLSGTYTSAVGCGAGKPRPLVGNCNGYAVTFSVNWEECVSTTAWSGTVDKSGAQPKLTTLWHLVLAKKPAWDSIVSGTDTFQPK